MYSGKAPIHEVGLADKWLPGKPTQIYITIWGWFVISFSDIVTWLLLETAYLGQGSPFPHIPLHLLHSDF